MSSSALPPLGNLPSWARVSSLDKNRFPKPFLRDRLATLPPTGSQTSLPPLTEEDSNDDLAHLQIHPRVSSQLDIPSHDIESLSQGEKRRLIYYNKTIKFLQKKHAETLDKLHSEIESLKQENKDLQFKSIMKRGKAAGSASSQRMVNGENEKIRELRLLLKNAQARNKMLNFALRKLTVSKSGTSVDRPAGSGNKQDDDAEMLLHDPEREDSTQLLEPLPPLTLPLGATLNPLRVCVEIGSRPRIPTLSECDVIIRHLHKANLTQMEENSYLRADIRSLIFARELKDRLESESLTNIARFKSSTTTVNQQ